MIANADAAEGFVSDEPPPDGSYARGAATALIDLDGIVPSGTVGRSLLAGDAGVPFGHRLDPEQVLAAFDGAWSGGDRFSAHRRVVLVEASTSAARRIRTRASGAQRRALRARALADADSSSVGSSSAWMASGTPCSCCRPWRRPPHRAWGSPPSVAPGSTLRCCVPPPRRNGYVQLADVALTVLSRSARSRRTRSRAAPRCVAPRAATGSGAWRMRPTRPTSATASSPAVVTVIVTALVGLALATWQRRRLGPRPRSVLAAAAFGVLAAVPATFLVGRIDVVGTNTLRYIVALVAITALIAAAAAWVERRWPGLGVTLGVAVIVAAIGIDVALGAPPGEHRVRLLGGGGGPVRRPRQPGLRPVRVGHDPAGCAHRRLTGDGAWALVMGLLAVVPLLEGLPMLGADVGARRHGPRCRVTAPLLAGRRIGWREVLAPVLATGWRCWPSPSSTRGAPRDVQTHLARPADHVSRGAGPRSSRASATLEASLGGAELAAWLIVSAVVVAAGVSTLGTGRVGPELQLGAAPPDGGRPPGWPCSGSSAWWPTTRRSPCR